MSLVETHEKRVSRFKMFFHMVIIGALVSLIVYGAIFWIHLNHLNRQFIDIGVPKSTFFHYLKNKYFWIPLSFFTDLYTDVEPEYQKIIGKDRVTARYYNRFIEFLFSRNKKTKALFERSIKSVSNYLDRFPVLFPLYLGFYILAFSLVSLLGKKNKHIRGTRLVSGFRLKRRLSFKCFKDRQRNISIGKLPIPFVQEVSHFLFMGTTRSGKSVTLNQMIDSILARKSASAPDHKLIVYDLKGEFVSKWYSKKDILFFPFDQRSIQYSLFNEIRSDIDFKIIAKSLFEPPQTVSNNLSFFYEAGGEVFKTGLILLNKSGKKTNKDILEFFAQDRTKIIQHFRSLPQALQGPVDYLVDSREAAGVLSTIHEKINFLEYLIDNDGPFSFRNYISDEKERRSLFIPNISNYKKIFIPLFSFGIDIMIKEVLSMPDDFKRRIFFLIDEFSSLHTIQSIFDFQRESGSKGGSLICAMQDLGDLGRNYGQERLRSFFNNFHTKFIFQLLDPDTQDYASRALGERQVHLRMPSHQYSPNDIGDRESVSLQNTNERIVLPSEFSLLKQLQCFVQLSNLGTAKITIPKIFYPDNSPHFIPQDYKINTEPDPQQEPPKQETNESKAQSTPDPPKTQPKPYKLHPPQREKDRGIANDPFDH